jgi:hypothetical protein
MPRFTDYVEDAPTANLSTGAAKFAMLNVDGTIAEATVAQVAVSAPFGDLYRPSVFTPTIRRQLLFNFVKDANNPIIDNANAALGEVYWPWIIKTADYIDSPIDVYYLYTSPDHQPANAGIELWTAPTPVGPWTNQGVVITPPSDAPGIETPSVMWSEEEQKLYLYAHSASVTGAVGSQTTVRFESTDGETWTYEGIAVDTLSNSLQLGSGHTGYLIPFRHGTLWGGYVLLGPGGMAWSNNGRDWSLDPMHMGYTIGYVNDASVGDRIEWNHCYPINIRGELWLIGFFSDGSSGPSAKDATIFAAPLSPDYRRIIGPPVQLLTLDASWESTDIRSIHVYAENSTIYLYYQCGNGGDIGVATMTVGG